MPGGAANTPGATWKVLAPMPSKHTSSSWNPDPYGTTEFELWEAYKSSVDAYHAEWVRNDPSRKSGYIYAFAMMGDGVTHRDGSQTMKIGYSRNPKARLKQISKSSVKMPYILRQWFNIWTSDMVRAERLLHLMLQRYRTNGEWFVLPQSIWESFDALWYIDNYHTHDDLEFRDGYTGGWFTPHDFFEYQLELYRQRVDHSGSRG